MKSTFRPTTPADRPQLAALLAAAFQDASPTSSLLHPDLMAWKYWTHRADWTEPRSYALERDGRLIAHAGIWPITFPAENPVRGVQMIDWCAAKDTPGAGLTLVQKFQAMFDFMYSIGGSDMTRKVLPGLGFIELTEAWTAARPLRPLRQILTHQHKNWKLAPRLVRNFIWSRSPARVANGWKLVPLTPSEIPCKLFSAGPQLTASPRPPAFFEYLLQCPSVRYRLYGLQNQNGLQGYFVLGLVRGQARITNLALLEPCFENWRAAFTLAQEAALRDNDANEIVAMGSKGITEDAAAQAGLRILTHTPVYLLNKRGRLSLAADFQFQMSDVDNGFFDSGQILYST